CAPLAGGAGGIVTAEGDNYIRFQSRDNAGNLENLKVQLVKIDKTNPAAALNSLLAFDGDGLVSIVWSASDGGSGVSEVQLYRNGTLINTSLNPSGSFVDDRSASANDGQTFAYAARAKDYSGRTGDSAAQSTTIDLSPPSVPNMIPLAAYTNALSLLVRWNRAVDTTAGVDFYNLYRNVLITPYATIDEADPNGTDTNAERSYLDNALADGGAFTYKVSATDLAVPSHESAKSDPTSSTIDVTAPVTTKTLNPSSPNGQNGWFVTAFGVTLSCADATSGCNDTKYSLNGGAFTTYTGTFMVSADGTYTIAYFSTDNAGNTETTKSQTEKLDQTKPVIANNPVPSLTNNPNLTVSGTVTDATSGVGGLTVNGSPVTLGAGGSYSKTVTLSEGSNTITEVATDVAGNIETVTKQVTLDTVAPVVTITSGPSSPTTETSATFTFTANEPATFECALDAGAFGACASPKTYTGLGEGTHNVFVRARDAAGNLGAPVSFSWTIVVSPDIDNDGIFNEIDTQPNTPSNDFDDRPIGGTTFGTISSRGGLTLAIEKPVASSVVRISASGAGTTAVIIACAENFKVLVSSGDVTDIVCGASITAEAIATPDDVTIRSATKNGRNGRLRLTQGQLGTMVDPPLEVTMTSAVTNATPVEFDVTDETTGNVLAAGKLDPTESIKVDFSDPATVSYTAVSGTIEMTADDAPLTLTAGQAFVEQCSGVGGNIAGTGCPVADKNTVTLHTVNLGGGPSTKALLAAVTVRVFDRNSSDFQAVAGSKNPDGSLYGIIYEADAGRVGQCVTGSDGICFAGEAAIGEYLVIVKYVDSATGKTVYVGRPKSPSDFVDTNNDGLPDLATKDFQIMKIFKKGVFQEYRGGSKLVVTGSMLEMLVPESAVWEGTQSLYPFVFTSDSDWTVDVCAEVPAGYALVGAYDENGDLVSETQCAQTVVANQTKVLAFEVKEVGSPEPAFVATLKLAHKGKVVERRVDVADLRMSAFVAKVKSAKAGREIERARGIEKVNAGKLRLTKFGASLWSIVRDAFGLEGRAAEIVAIGKRVAQFNAIRVPEWGVTEGKYDARALPWGFVLDLGDEKGLRLMP
ncbi:MAG: hypothetical protein HYW56_02010, partial [Candidatus Harrisonbacteria bacterium]|nr:hypothetical protein [Candidatus Harrisonbacteria bacterium]